MEKRAMCLVLLGAVLMLVACAPGAAPVPEWISPSAPATMVAVPSPTATMPPTAGPSPGLIPAVTGEAEPGEQEKVTLAAVLFVRARLQLDGTWTFEVTVQHEDTGWEHYADRWEVLTLEGEVLATRVLAHPHVDEQPFTRSQGGILIAEEIDRVRVRAHDGVHGYGGREVVADLTADEGQDFEVIR
jgi:hypothetical protein